MPSFDFGFEVRNLAEAAAAGPWTAAAIAARLRRAVGGRPRGMTALARRLVAAHPGPPTPEQILVALRADPSFPELPRTVHQVFWSAPVMDPRHGWDLPVLRTTTDVAEWLGLTPGKLDWFADVQGRNPRQPDPRLQHYTHRWVSKRGGRYRLLEVPKPRLKAIQRKLLHELLDRIPPHDAVHGFRAGRSIRSFAEPHVGRAAVWRIDLKDFFRSVPASRVHAIFQTAGYPVPVARTFTGLCSTTLPAGVRSPNTDELHRPFRRRHLPQGAPTSPALANLCAYRLDIRLAAWAAACGATYTRYADDLAFSGADDWARRASRFRRMVFQIILEEGSFPNVAKSRWMTPGGRQQLAGVVVNRRPNVCRNEFDRLKAILTNCIRHGPTSQNLEGRPDFRAHLMGKIAHLASIHPVHGAKLRALAAQIIWPC
jgi:RNA-directed DNA polymerase